MYNWQSPGAPIDRIWYTVGQICLSLLNCGASHQFSKIVDQFLLFFAVLPDMGDYIGRWKGAIPRKKPAGGRKSKFTKLPTFPLPLLIAGIADFENAGWRQGEARTLPHAGLSGVLRRSPWQGSKCPMTKDHFFTYRFSLFPPVCQTSFLAMTSLNLSLILALDTKRRRVSRPED
jgi:hypothetical protein